MNKISENEKLIEQQKNTIEKQITQGKDVLKTLTSSVSMTIKQIPGQGQGLRQAHVQRLRQVQVQGQAQEMQAQAQISKLEEEEKKKRKKDDWFSKPNLLKSDWEKNKRKHDEKVKKAESDIKAYEDFVADKTEDEIKELENVWEKPGFRTPFQVLRKAKKEAEVFIKDDVIPRADIDKRFAVQREARKKVLLEFQNSLNSSNEERKKITDQIYENNNKKNGYRTVPDKIKNNDEEYIQINTKGNTLNNEKYMVDVKIKKLTDKKDAELKLIDGEITKLKAEAKDKEIGGKKTRKRRTKNMKRRQSRKYKV